MTSADRPLIFSDLDDTLFQTRGKCPPGSGELSVMSTLVDGSPSGYCTTVQRRLLAWLTIGQLVPVTARSSGVLARVNIVQAPAICSNGGRIILDDGSVDEDWHQHLQLRSKQHPDVADVHSDATSGLGSDFRHWIVSEDRLDLYCVIKSNNGDDALHSLLPGIEKVLPPGWRVHLNGNNLALLPPWVGKRAAVATMIARTRREQPDRPILGVGDSRSDAGFMDLCDFAMMPTASQLWRSAVGGNEWIGDA